MKDKKKLLFLIGLVVLFIVCILLFIFINNNNRNKLNYIYECESYNDKFYNSNSISNISYSCNKKKFKCNDCEIFTHYIKNKIAYLQGKDKIVIYDFKKKKIIDKFNVKLTEYKQDGKTYKDVFTFFDNLSSDNFALVYDGKDDKEYIYSSKNNIHIKIDGNVCSYKGNVINVKEQDFCGTGYIGAINEDRVIVNNPEKGYGILNLNTGEYDLPLSQEYIVRDEYYNYESKSYEPYYLLKNNILDKDLKPMFSKDLVIKPAEKLSDDLIMAYDWANDAEIFLIFIDKNMEEKYKISFDVIGYELYKEISNVLLKNSITVREIADSVFEEDNYYIDYSVEEKSIYLSFYYNNDKYEEYTKVGYKYNLISKVLEKVDINGEY